MQRPAPVGADFFLQPVSAKERAVWVLYQYLPGEGVLNFSLALEPVTELDLPALRAAVVAVMQRHENLRTLFPAAPDGEPRRLTLTADDPLLAEIVTVREVRPAELAEEQSREMSAGFDLTAQPPIRVSVLRCDGADVIIVTVSHIAYDGFSQSVLRAEIEQAYAALHANGRPPASFAHPLSSPPLQDPDEETLGYWRDLLAGARPSRDLDIGWPRGREAGYPGVTLRQRIRPEVWEAAAAIARGTSSPVTAVLLAGLAAVLNRHGAGDDIVIGLPNYNRGMPPHRAIGYYASITGVRVRVDADKDFSLLVRQCAEQMLEGLQHGGVSVDNVIPGAFEASDPGGRPLVRYMLNYMADMPAQPEQGAVLRDCPPPRRIHSRMELDLMVEETSAGPVLRAIYASDLFSTAEMDRLLGRLQAILVAASAGGAVGALDMSTEADLADLASMPAAETPPPPLLADEIATSAFANPCGAAVVPVAAGRGLSYSELDASAAALGAELADRGVAPGERVGVLADSLADTVIGVLGCWAAGGAAVLLAQAPDGPDAGVIVATEPAGPGVVPIRRITSQGTAAYFPSPEDLALVVRDGGSSVALSHEALAQAASTLAADLPLTSSDLVAVGPSAGCGPEFLEVLLTLAAGARVLPMAAADQSAARHALDQGASVLVTSPDVADGLLTGSAAGRLPANVRVVLRGGWPAPGLADRSSAAGVSMLRVTGPLGSAGVVLVGALPDEAGLSLMGRMPPLPGLRLADRSGAQALPLMWGRLLDRDGADVLGVPVRAAAGGWLETMDDRADGGVGDDLAVTGLPVSGTAEAFGVDFVDLWRTILERPEATAEDNFFALGGDSVCAARLVAQVRERIGVKMSLRAVLTAPTPVSFAAAVRAAAERGSLDGLFR